MRGILDSRRRCSGTTALPGTAQPRRRIPTMTDPEEQDAETPSQDRDEAGLPKDDERLIREDVEETGEPIRDRLGNADGGS
jgi:hypothetical protein